MKSLFLTTSLSRALGGIFEIERSLALELHKLGVGVEVAGLEDPQWEEDRPSWGGISASAHPVKGPAAFGYSPGLSRQVMASTADVLHLHALWMYPSVLAARWGRTRKKPYMVTPNGMLEPWALANSRWKKKIAGWAYESRNLQNAWCLQANTEKEMADFRNFGLKQPVAIIPNGVYLPASPVPDRRRGQGPRTLLFLGRIHPKKGLEPALRAWSELASEREGWQLVIAGWNQGGHQQELMDLARNLRLDALEQPVVNWLEDRESGRAGQIVFTGPAFGAEKEDLLRKADAFLLPSRSEGLPMAVLEAWAYGLPVAMTEACNLEVGFERGGAVRLGSEVGGIVDGLRMLLGMPDEALADIGAKGRALVEGQFTWEQVATQIMGVYQWLEGGGEAPACIAR